jgi:hypothetical protein
MFIFIGMVKFFSGGTASDDVDSLVTVLWRINYVEWLPMDAILMDQILTSGPGNLLFIDKRNLLRFIKLGYSEADANRVCRRVMVRVGLKELTELAELADGGDEYFKSRMNLGFFEICWYQDWGSYNTGKLLGETLLKISDPTSWQREVFGDSVSCWSLLEILKNLTNYVDCCLSKRSAMPAQQLDLVELIRMFLNNFGPGEGNYPEHPHWRDCFHKIRSDTDLFNSCQQWCHSAIVELAGANSLRTQGILLSDVCLQVLRKAPDSTASSILTEVGKAPNWSEIPVVDLDAGNIGARYEFRCTGEIDKHLHVDTSSDIIYIYCDTFTGASDFPGAPFSILKGNRMAR